MNKPIGAHLAYWVCFGGAAAGIYVSFTLGPTFAALFGVMSFALLGVVSLDGLYRTWALMTENER